MNPGPRGLRGLALPPAFGGRPLRVRQVAWLMTALFLAGITALAQLRGLKLLLFPELGALASVVISDPASRWARSPWLLVLTPTLTAAAGILVSTHLPYGPVAVALVVAAGLLVLRILRSPVAPALSAGYLPVALGIRSWTYPLAILIALAALVLLTALWARLPASFVSASEAVAAEPRCPFPPPRRWLPPLAVFLTGALLLVRLLGSHLVLYPPLLVIAWETLAEPEHCPWRRRPGALLAVTTGTGLVGLVLARALGPVPLTAFLAVLFTALLLDRLRLTCPPAFAVALLPLVLPQPPWFYPLLVLAGGGWLVLLAALLERLAHSKGSQ